MRSPLLAPARPPSERTVGLRDTTALRAVGASLGNAAIAAAGETRRARPYLGLVPHAFRERAFLAIHLPYAEYAISHCAGMHVARIRTPAEATSPRKRSIAITVSEITKSAAPAAQTRAARSSSTIRRGGRKGRLAEAPSEAQRTIGEVPEGPAAPAEEESGYLKARRRTWVQLLARVYGVDALKCGRCPPRQKDCRLAASVP